MTVYNGEDYLPASLRSVLTQTWKDFEFLIIDDCSVDHSSAIIKSCHDQRIVVHRNEINKGQTASLNLGLRLARGRYIARIDADDVAFPRWLERQWAFVDRHPDYAVVSANAVIIDEQGRITRELKSLAQPRDMLLKSMLASPINHGVALMNKALVLENGAYDEAQRVVADFGLWSRLLRKGYPLTSTNETLMAIRVHSKQSSFISGQDAYVPELTGILRDNIRYLSACDCGRQDVERLCRAFYCTGTLSDAEFERAVCLLKDIYRHLQPAAGMDGGRVWLKKQLRSLFLKRIYCHIANGAAAAVRATARSAGKECGHHRDLVILMAVSYCGMTLLKRIPAWHRLACGFKTRLKFSGITL